MALAFSSDFVERTLFVSLGCDLCSCCRLFFLLLQGMPRHALARSFLLPSLAASSSIAAIRRKT